MSEIAAGFYKGRAVAGSEQYGLTSNGNNQIALDVNVPSINRTLTVFLYFTEAGMPYALEKLRACGWTGDDVLNLKDVDKNEIDVSIKYEDYKGEKKMRVDISAGAGRVVLQNALDDKSKRSFQAIVKNALKAAGATPAPKAADNLDDFPI